ncbi:hypothetical protein Ddc_16396 [Ditylenchus destructor]|nr:hypothetical protein Ddc_16396 [Ditylenchus destructor]
MYIFRSKNAAKFCTKLQSTLSTNNPPFSTCNFCNCIIVGGYYYRQLVVIVTGRCHATKRYCAVEGVCRCRKILFDKKNKRCTNVLNVRVHMRTSMICEGISQRHTRVSSHTGATFVTLPVQLNGTGYPTFDGLIRTSSCIFAVNATFLVRPGVMCAITNGMRSAK